jgi:hypothetical protein
MLDPVSQVRSRLTFPSSEPRALSRFVPARVPAIEPITTVYQAASERALDVGQKSMNEEDQQ